MYNIDNAIWIMIKLQITKTYDVKAGSGAGQYLYYYRVIVNDTVTISDLANVISKRCTVQRADCEAAIVAFCQVIRELLLQSCSAKLNKIGTFRLTCSSGGQEEATPYNVLNIKRLKTNYLPDTGIKYYLDPSRVNFSVINPPAKEP